MPKMRVTKRHKWNEKTVHPGDEYDANINEALIVEGLGWASRVEVTFPQPRQKRAYRRRDMTAEQ